MPVLTKPLFYVPSVDEIFHCQEAVAIYCVEMMKVARQCNDGAMFAYYRRLANIASEEEVFPYIVPLVYRGGDIVRSFDRNKAFLRNKELFESPTIPSLEVIPT